MGLNKVDDYFRKDTELQNYTKTGVKRIINSFIFQNNFQSLPVHFLHFEKNVLRVSFEMPPSDKTEIHTHVTNAGQLGLESSRPESSRPGYILYCLLFSPLFS